MRKRKLWWVAVGLAMLLVAAGAFVAWPEPSSPVTWQNYSRLRYGMSWAEVEAILEILGLDKDVCIQQVGH